MDFAQQHDHLDLCVPFVCRELGQNLNECYLVGAIILCSEAYCIHLNSDMLVGSRMLAPAVWSCDSAPPPMTWDTAVEFLGLRSIILEAMKVWWLQQDMFFFPSGVCSQSRGDRSAWPWACIAGLGPLSFGPSMPEFALSLGPWLSSAPTTKAC